jgi:hypothetical protein
VWLVSPVANPSARSNALVARAPVPAKRTGSARVAASVGWVPYPAVGQTSKAVVDKQARSDSSMLDPLGMKAGAPPDIAGGPPLQPRRVAHVDAAGMGTGF